MPTLGVYVTGLICVKTLDVQRQHFQFPLHHLHVSVWCWHCKPLHMIPDRLVPLTNIFTILLLWACQSCYSSVHDKHKKKWNEWKKCNCHYGTNQCLNVCLVSLDCWVEWMTLFVCYCLIACVGFVLREGRVSLPLKFESFQRTLRYHQNPAKLLHWNQLESHQVTSFG